ncbi:hypothetical protein TVNIR_3062 [Thioalkalivibrio nitratireducens DSM 14787]|uniref:SnoaL-like domain-containing protein n=1 Tax=Thioalkalivibrio nitratireducens (strain DSM 14787 / UNIQEM 213 / ALEN2) TaxID=1255043 RepID=L0DYM7_THIND|nr:nuclear transport factor 2 family protein [Thioalkalivibrio nitratireducens]AGA34699.1 hypothetical protein TVNIR_3062 [Thioalkalivibrio nitratireducens DSM 14787]
MAATVTANLSDNLHRALEEHDLNLLLSLYADDADLRVIDQRHPPSTPLELHGKEAITNYFREIFERPLTHRIEEEVVADDHMAFTEACEYADGMRVFCSAMMQLRDGKIVREVDVQAWDETTH